MNHSSLKASLISIFTGSLICVLKFLGFYITGSRAILSDALESIINVIAAVLAALSIHHGAQEADEDHLYGHWKLEYFSAGFEGALVFMAGIGILITSIPALITGNQVEKMGEGIFLIVIASVLNGLLGWYLVHTGKKNFSAALVADGKHVLSDFYTSLGLLGGLFAVYLTDIPWLDPTIATIMGVWILFNGIQILRESYHNLMDKASPELLESVMEAMRNARPHEMIRPHRLRVRESGPGILLDFHVILPRYLTVEEVHEVEVNFGRKLEEELKRPVDLLLHTDPCIRQNCRICDMPGCKIRSAARVKQASWAREALLEDIRHPYSD